MKKFLLKTIIFISLGFIAYSLTFVILKSNLKQTIASSEVIILGDSHTECLYLPKTFNYSISAGPYILHYNFAKTFKKQFEGKKVIIAFGLHNISKLYENRFRETTFKEGWLPMVNNELNAYSLIEASYNYVWVANNQLIDIISKNKITKTYNLSLNKDRKNIDRIDIDTSSFKTILDKHFFNEEYIYPDSIQVKYLTMLVDFLEKNNCTVYFINTPVTDYYYQNVPQIVKNQYSDILSKFDIKYYDLNKLLSSQIDSTYFKDADHLNEKGDKILEQYLTNEIME